MVFALDADADFVGTADGATLATWGGLARRGTPTLKQNYRNAKNAVRLNGSSGFDGTNSILDTAQALTSAVGGGITFQIVVSLDVIDTSLQTVFAKGLDYSDRWWFVSDAARPSRYAAVTVGTVTSNPWTSPNQLYLLQYTYTKTGVDVSGKDVGTETIRLAGQPAATATGQIMAPLNTSGLWRVGEMNGGYGLTGYVSQIRVDNRVLSDAELANDANYWQKYYNDGRVQVFALGDSRTAGVDDDAPYTQVNAVDITSGTWETQNNATLSSSNGTVTVAASTTVGNGADSIQIYPVLSGTDNVVATWVVEKPILSVASFNRVSFGLHSHTSSSAFISATMGINGDGSLQMVRWTEAGGASVPLHGTFTNSSAWSSTGIWYVRTTWDATTFGMKWEWSADGTTWVIVATLSASEVGFSTRPTHASVLVGNSNSSALIASVKVRSLSYATKFASVPYPTQLLPLLPVNSEVYNYGYPGSTVAQVVTAANNHFNVLSASVRNAMMPTVIAWWGGVNDFNLGDKSTGNAQTAGTALATAMLAYSADPIPYLQLWADEYDNVTAGWQAWRTTYDASVSSGAPNIAHSRLKVGMAANAKIGVAGSAAADIALGSARIYFSGGNGLHPRGRNTNLSVGGGYGVVATEVFRPGIAALFSTSTVIIVADVVTPLTDAEISQVRSFIAGAGGYPAAGGGLVLTQGATTSHHVLATLGDFLPLSISLTESNGLPTDLTGCSLAATYVDTVTALAAPAPAPLVNISSAKRGTIAVGLFSPPYAPGTYRFSIVKSLQGQADVLYGAITLIAVTR